MLSWRIGKGLKIVVSFTAMRGASTIDKVSDILSPSIRPIWAGRILEWADTCWTSFISELHLTGDN